MTIPNELEDAVNVLVGMARDLTKEQYDEMMQLSEESFLAETHHVMGRWIRNNWNLWAGKGGLYNDLRDRGLDHPDDMSGIVMRCLYRELHNIGDLDIDDYVDQCRIYWEQQEPNDVETEET